MSENEIRAQAVREAAAYLDRVTRAGLVSKRGVLDDLAAVAYRMERGMTARGSTRPAALAEQGEPSDQIKQLLRDLTDPDDCEFDHHGGCQAHGYLSLQPGELCPHAEAKQLIAGWLPVPNTTKAMIRCDYCGDDLPSVRRRADIPTTPNLQCLGFDADKVVCAECAEKALHPTNNESEEQP